jgi:hypothetical protein
LVINSKVLQHHQHHDRSPPQSLLLFSTTAEEATRKVLSFAKLRFPDEKCRRDRVILDGNTLTESSFVDLLDNYPDAIVLVDWTGGNYDNYPVFKRGLDSNCAISGCGSRSASLFVIVTDLTKQEFASKLGIDLIARITLQSLD